MSKRSSSPALYEVFPREAPSSGEIRRVEPRAAAPAPPRERGPGRSIFSPGSMVHFPVGYGLAGLAAALLLVVGAYWLGYQRGEAVTSRKFNDEMADRFEAARTHGAVQDPLARPSDNRGNLGTSKEVLMATDPGPGTPTEPTSRAAGVGPVESDPRQAGINYFVLAAYMRDSAVELAEFCRARGLEAYAIKDNNLRFHKVIVVPGYAPGQRQSPAIKALEARIIQVGAQWDQAGKKDNLKGYYPDKHEG